MEHKRKLPRAWAVAATPLLVALMLAAIYYLDGIYPFGTETIVQGDIEAQYGGYYTKLWDWLHGSGSLFYRWDIGAGLGFFGTAAQYTLLSPLNLLLFLIPRDGVLYFFGGLAALKIVLCAASGGWYFYKRFPALPSFFVLFFGVAYGLSGYAMRQYCNFMWFEPVILLPVVLYTGERLLRGGKIWPFAVVLGASFLMNYYITAMVCVYLFFAGGCYILLLLPKAEKGRAVLRLALGAAIGLLLTAAVTVPVFRQLFSSQRFASKGDIALLDTFRGVDTTKALALFSLTFAVPLLLPYFFRSLRGARVREGAYLLFSILIVVLPLFFRGVDMVWHFGSYFGFPYRYGFLAVFAVLAASAQAVCRGIEDGDRVWAAENKGRRIVACCLAGVTTLFFVRLCILAGDEIFEIFCGGRKGYAYMTAMALLAYTFTFAMPQKKLRNAFLLLTLCAQLGSYGISFFNTGKEASEISAFKAMSLGAYQTETDGLSRTKNADMIFPMGYGTYMQSSELGGFCSMFPNAYLVTMERLMYAAIPRSQMLMGTGGTLFTDALFGVKSTVARENAFAETDEAYRLLGSVDGAALYENAYRLPFGMVGSAALAALPIDGVSFVDCENALFSAVGGEGTLLTVLAPVWETDGDGVSCTLVSDGSQRFYLLDTQRNPGTPVAVSVEAEGGARTVSEAYPKGQNAELLDLGSIPDGSSVLRLTADAPPTDRFQLLALDEACLSALCRKEADAPSVTEQAVSGAELSLKATAAADGDVLFLPVTYEAGWTCLVDGAPAPVVPILGAFLGVPLERGTHTVILRYRPVGLVAGIVLGAAGLLLATGLALLERKRTVLAKSPAWLNGIALVVLVLIWGAAVFLLYGYAIRHSIRTAMFSEMRY